MSKIKTATQPSYEPIRRLSPWRVMVAIVLVGGILATSMFSVNRWQDSRFISSNIPWFGGYVDVTATPTFAFEQMGAATHRNAVLSFIVSQPANPCTPSWGSAYTLDEASDTLDLDRRVVRLQQQGGSVAISFGGRDNHELAIGCSDPSKLMDAYKSVVQRYDTNTIDLDLEGNDLADTAAGARRATAIAQLQKDRRAAGKQLAVWVTLPVSPQGLAENGTNAVAQLLAKGVDVAGVNIMTMDYGSSLATGQTMLDGSESALIQTHRQLNVLYLQAGVHLNDASLWAKIGATPMIGQNDTAKQIFKVSDAATFNTFARKHGLSRLSMWSANRDQQCGSNYTALTQVSNSCSGVQQAKQAFSLALGNGFKGNIASSAGAITTADPVSEAQTKPDDPASSPYQIWSDSGTYLQGTKVVWRHNVYQAKWWTQGDTPDDPVLQTWQTPWELIGPVLPGEKPVIQAKLPEGTYPDWVGTNVYEEGSRVLFSGVPYQAKWWTQGASPAAASSNPNGSPWTPLTQTQVNDLLATLPKTS